MSRLAQLVERKTLNLVVVGSSPTVGVILFLYAQIYQYYRFFAIKKIGSNMPLWRYIGLNAKDQKIEP